MRAKSCVFLDPVAQAAVALAIVCGVAASGCSSLRAHADDPRSPLSADPGGLGIETRDWLGVPALLPVDGLVAAAEGAGDDRAAIGNGVGDALPVPRQQAPGDSTRAGVGDPAAHRVSVEAVRVPLDSLLFLLAKDARLELVSHADVATLSAPVTLDAGDLPLARVLDTLADQVEFDWRIEHARLIVRDARLYSDTYAIEYLNLDRTTRSSVGLATRVGTLSTVAGLDAGIANSSETLVENVGEHRFWASLADDIDGLLEASDPVGDEGGDTGGARFSINREAGLLTVHAEPDAHRAVQRFVARLSTSAQRQVLIEASVVEVTLSSRFETGIDWQLLADGINGISAAQILSGVPAVTADNVSRLSAPAALVSLVDTGGRGDVTATLSLLEEFGDVRILSRPRIIALNNQTSVLKVVDNRVYFTARVERLLTEERDEIVTETEIHTVPVGLVMNVTPHIGADGTVMLNVRPTLSRILGFVDDPNPELALARVRNGVPEIQVREMESMLRVQSGDVAIIGGLMQDALRDNDRGVAGLARLPIIGPLFSQRRRERDRTELLVVLRPTVMRAGRTLAAPRRPLAIPPYPARDGAG